MATAIAKLTKGYFHIHDKQQREYFGLRDFYSVVKMVLAKVRQEGEEPSGADIRTAVRINFGGYFGNFDPVEEFLKKIELDIRGEAGKELSNKALILEAIKQQRSETRFEARDYLTNQL